MPVVFTEHESGLKENLGRQKTHSPLPVVVIHVIKYDKLCEIVKEKQVNVGTTLVTKAVLMMRIATENSLAKQVENRLVYI